jgi:hypothetical protein
MDPHNTAAIMTLAEDLRQHQIDTVFVYVSYLKSNGAFNSTYDHAKEFVTAIKQVAPDLVVQGWLGIPAKVPPGTPPLPSGYVELADPTIQETIVRFSQSVVHDFGFDGVHLDAEPVLTGDAAFLALLEKVRHALGSQAYLSIAGREITPFFPEADLIVNRWFTWRADYYREIANRVDQIAVMAYDSHATFPLWYEQWMHFQVVYLTNSLSESSADLFIGIPTSEEHSSAHDPAVENMQTGLRGFIAGLNDSDTQSERIAGIAIYPYWETTEDEWQTYSKLWLGQTEQ